MEKELERLFDKISDEKKPILIVTNDFSMVNGNDLEIMNLITLFVNSLIEKGYPKRLIKGAFTTGMMGLEEAKKTSEDLDNSSSLIELFEKIEKILGE